MDRQVGQWFFLLAGLVLPGCIEALPPAAAPNSPGTAETAAHFDPATAGSILGQVTWDGALPQIELVTLPAIPYASEVFRQRQVRPNPNAPQIDAGTRGVGNAVLFLRGVSGEASRPWDHPAVCVEQRECAFHIRQGSTDSSYGFVRRGDPVVLVSRERVFHALHAGGAAFFSFMFPAPDQPLTRCLPDPGIVELTSAAGYAWMRAYLFVDDHPYYARTNSEGRFVLPQVPPGRYELVCWMPNWLRARHERDPETGVISRLYFKPPVEQVRTVHLAEGASAVVNFSGSCALFR